MKDWFAFRILVFILISWLVHAEIIDGVLSNFVAWSSIQSPSKESRSFKYHFILAAGLVVATLYTLLSNLSFKCGNIFHPYRTGCKTCDVINWIFLLMLSIADLAMMIFYATFL